MERQEQIPKIPRMSTVTNSWWSLNRSVLRSFARPGKEEQGVDVNSDNDETEKKHNLGESDPYARQRASSIRLL